MLVVKGRDALMTTTIAVAFEDMTLTELAAMPQAERDELPFGVIGLDSANIVQIYNVTESRLAGLPASAVVGVPFFEAVAQCMNNFMVAQRFLDTDELDEIIPFMLTLRMRPTRVRLRLLSSRSQPLHYILIER